MCKTLPAALKDSAELSATEQLPGDVIRRYLAMMLAYRSYLIHRAFFAKSLSDKTYQESRRACVNAAEDIVACIKKGMPPTFLRLWSTAIWMVSAGIVLSLDLIHASRQQLDVVNASTQRGKLSHLMKILSTIEDKSGIGVRGAKLISHLSSIEQQTTANSPIPFFTRQDIVEVIQSSNANDESNFPLDKQWHERQSHAQGSKQPLDPHASNAPYGSIYSNLEGPDFASLTASFNVVPDSPVDFIEPDHSEMSSWDLTQFDAIFGDISNNNR